MPVPVSSFVPEQEPGWAVLPAVGLDPVGHLAVGHLAAGHLAFAARHLAHLVVDQIVVVDPVGHL